MSDIVSPNPFRALDRDGIPAPGALAYFFLSGTTTPQVVYTTQALDVAHPIPLEANSQGVFPPVFSAVALRCTVTDSSGTTLPGYPIDPVPIIPTGSGAAQVTFEPTADIPETNVQSAIERVQANLVAPLLAGGIGVTGNATPLTNIDATNTASGAYRFETGATGTFPSGVTAAGGGTIRLWRETAAEAVMELNPRGSNVTWVRTMTGSVWGAWVRMPATLATLDVTATAAELNLLDGLTRSFSGDGYTFLPGGLLVQWGAYSIGGGGGASDAVTFPIPFPTALRAAYVGSNGGASNMIGTTSRTNSGMSVIKGAGDVDARTGFWLAIGN